MKAPRVVIQKEDSKFLYVKFWVRDDNHDWYELKLKIPKRKLVKI